MTTPTPEETTKANEASWIKHFWRPAMAWQYLLVCMFDFLVAPALSMALSAYTGTPHVQWEPLTLKESAYYHIAMGLIIGVAAYTRGQEKIKQVEVNAQQQTTTTTTTTPTEGASS